MSQTLFLVAVETDGTAKSSWAHREAIEQATAGKVFPVRLDDFVPHTQSALARALDQPDGGTGEH